MTTEILRRPPNTPGTTSCTASESVRFYGSFQGMHNTVLAASLQRRNETEEESTPRVPVRE